MPASTDPIDQQPAGASVRPSGIASGTPRLAVRTRRWASSTQPLASGMRVQEIAKRSAIRSIVTTASSSQRRTQVSWGAAAAWSR